MTKKNTVRTRFAPSPTGRLHIGGARTALFCWLYARHCGGQFILRIEDTDVERSKEEFVDSIRDGLAWLGMHSDEEPLYQSQRLPIYQRFVDQLMNEGKAYRCYCSAEELDKMRTEQMARGQKPKYDGRCFDREPVAGMPFVIRFRVPRDGVVSFYDEARGEISVENRELDDFVIVRSDGMPTYNFCVVIDDHLTQITDVIRGDDHINNTPKQIHLFEAFGFQRPRFTHLPMIHGDDGKKLSKRHGALDVMDYFSQGFLPEAVINFLARLGWSHQDQEIFTTDELVAFFSLSNISRSPAIFNIQKLLWLNQQYIQKMEISALKAVVAAYDELLVKNETIEQALELYRPRAQTILELIAAVQPIYNPVTPSKELLDKYFDATTRSEMALLAEKLQIKEKTQWSPELLNATLKQFTQDNGLPFSKVGKPLRLALLGLENSPDLGALMAIIGQETVLKRLQAFCL